MKNEKLDYEILKRYKYEMNEINNKLDRLERRRVYEISGVNQDGNLQTNIQQLRKLILDLLDKIQNGEEGEGQKLSKSKDKFQF